MNSKTIDGELVSREQLERFLVDMGTTDGRRRGRKELRALLDAPASAAHMYPLCTVLKTCNVGASNSSVPAAQPQGGPVEYDQAKENKLFEDWARTQSDVSLRLCDIGLYYKRDIGLAHDAWQHRAKLAGHPAPVAQKYDDTLLPFMALMRKELHANSDKGDREGWLGMTSGTALSEIEHHRQKLVYAVACSNADAIKEHAADVANCAMMLADVCGCFDISPSGAKQ